MNYTTKVYKESRMLELMLFDDTDLSLLFNMLMQEYGESGFCELYKAANLIIDGEIDTYSFFIGSSGISIEPFKVILWLDSYDGDKLARSLSVTELCNLLETYRREWLKEFGNDLIYRTFAYTPFIDGIITDEDYGDFDFWEDIEE